MPTHGYINPMTCTTTLLCLIYACYTCILFTCISYLLPNIVKPNFCA
nr:MAG TPA: hypothetical protein [Caudoviricetes sp.]